MILLSSPLKFDPRGNMVTIIFFHGIVIVTTRIVNEASLRKICLLTMDVLKVQMNCFFIAEFERAAKIRKNAVYRFLISLLAPEL